MEIALKNNVQVMGIQPELLLALMVAESVYRAAGQRFTVTSLLDGQHSRNSLHYKGAAADLRTRDLSGITATEIGRRIKERLTADYDVVVEPDHIHLEFQPKEVQ